MKSSKCFSSANEDLTSLLSLDSGDISGLILGIINSESEIVNFSSIVSTIFSFPSLVLIPSLKLTIFPIPKYVKLGFLLSHLAKNY